MPLCKPHALVTSLYTSRCILECKSVFITSAQPRRGARTEPADGGGPAMQPSDTTLLPHNLAIQDTCSPPSYHVRTLTAHFQAVAGLNLSGLHGSLVSRHRSRRRVLPFHALRPWHLHVMLGTAVSDDAQGLRRFKPSAHTAGLALVKSG